MATARIRLTSSHGLQTDTETYFGYDKEDDWKNITISSQAPEDPLFTFKLIKRDKITIYMKADSEAEFRGWIDSLMHEIRRLISEKEKCFSALNQKTINDTSLTSVRVSDRPEFVTELSTKPISDQTVTNEGSEFKDEDEESNLSIANSSILSVQTLKSKPTKSENQLQPHLHNQITVRSGQKDITDNKPISSSNHHPYQRHSTKSLQDNTTPLFVSERRKRLNVLACMTNGHLKIT
jgi:hypothetical protein